MFMLLGSNFILNQWEALSHVASNVLYLYWIYQIFGPSCVEYNCLLPLGDKFSAIIEVSFVEGCFVHKLLFRIIVDILL